MNQIERAHGARVLPALSWWINENTGEVVCSDHAGAELTAHIRQRPDGITFMTPFGRWTRIPESERALVEAGLRSMELGDTLADLCWGEHAIEGGAA